MSLDLPPPLLLSVAGHDPSGGAGLTTDLAAWAALGCRGSSVCTALTVQNSRGVQGVQPVAPQTLRAALDAVTADEIPAAVKLGMLGDAAVAEVVADFCARLDAPVVWDPVLAAAAGGTALLRDAGAELLRRLAHAACVITPNLDEAPDLFGLPPWNGAGELPQSWVQILRRDWLGQGRTQAIVVKGGHADGESSVDWLVTQHTALPFIVPRQPLPAGQRVHGTGCHFASTLAGMLGLGWSVADAVAEAQQRTAAGIRHAWGVARPMVRAGVALDSATLPRQPLPAQGLDPAAPFAPMQLPIGFYPVVPDADWALRLLDWGVSTLQLRVKDLQGQALRQAIERVSRAAAGAGAQLFINDHWREAIDAGAFGVHLGQEDLDRAELSAIRGAGLRLGLSTHTPAEFARAAAQNPSYLAFGPVYPTMLKQMPYRPLGLARLRDWVARCSPRFPTVGIGGISLERAPGVLDCGVDGFAVVSAVTQAADPRAAVHRGLQLAQQAAEWRAAIAAS